MKKRWCPARRRARSSLQHLVGNFVSEAIFFYLTIVEIICSFVQGMDPLENEVKRECEHLGENRVPTKLKRLPS